MRVDLYMQIVYTNNVNPHKVLMHSFDKFEWDAAKRLTTLDKHGIDFVDAAKIFSSPYVRAGSKQNSEERWIAIGLLEGIEIAVIYTIRGNVCRLITARRARIYERKIYHAHVS
jgi:uncharacterized protein